MSDKKLVGIYLPREIIKQLKKIAAEEETNVSELVNRLVNNELEYIREEQQDGSSQ